MKKTKIINLKDKYIVINGGLGLIGSSISKKCLEFGATVLIIDNSKKSAAIFKSENIEYSKKFKILIKNSASNKSINSIIKEIKKFKKVNSFINCAYPRDKYWYDNTFKSKNINSFINNIKTNYITNIWLTKEIAELFKSKKINSTIILFSSIYGMVGQDMEIYKNSNIKENISYSLIKGGILNFTRLMASYYGKNNIRINCISPGGVRSPKNTLQDKQFLKNYSKRVPLKRMANPEEIANATVFLTSDLSTYMNGSNLVVDGGWTSI